MATLPLPNFQFRGIHIPAEIVHRLIDKSLKVSGTRLKLLVVIESLVNCRGAGCWASNQYLADLIGSNKTHVSEIVNGMVRDGWLVKTEKDGIRYLETCWSRIPAPPSAFAEGGSANANRPLRQMPNIYNKVLNDKRGKSPPPKKRYLEDADLWHRELSRRQRLGRNGGPYRVTNAESFRKLVEVDGLDYKSWLSWYCCLSLKDLHKLGLPSVSAVEDLRKPKIWSWIMRIWTEVQAESNQEDVLPY